MNDSELFAYRIFKHGLVSQVSDILTPFTRIIGIQAQNQRAAELNVALQTGSTMEKLNNLYDSDKIVRAWGQRWTVHLFTHDDWQLVINARQNEKLPNMYFRGIPNEIHEAVSYISSVLEDQKELTRGEYQKSMMSKFDWYKDCPHNTDYTIFQILTAQGKLASNPHHSQQGMPLIYQADFVRQDQLTATTELIKRYIHGFGPASINDFVKWSGIRISNVRPAWEKVESEFCPILWRDQTLWMDQKIDSTTFAEIEEMVSAKTVIAAGFCSLMTGYLDKSWFVDPDIQKKMWSVNGLLKAPIIAHGKVAGKWNYNLTNKKIKFEVEKWSQFNSRQLEQNFHKIAKFLNREYDGCTVI
ncbi:DNA glycosylase AlkZ-like family protein [Companilactobacillus ginsenosidimutans]|uniref:Winged helix DNA-binding domain-containing protein n=1 Tax=Companilactobacillus ginsenosidimutans TaxID=1007676 RepID=A0A0H4QKP1_9LACO|nr:crosslink repair DNA glycosylase YcaQ family protein [Companilactobacillus ginsenosidimutans]AKP67666.1 hypothetical protein ABM34_09090 [Companilactobacillus ginsenosidimutans]